jgi:Protein of unknown function, DUF488
MVDKRLTKASPRALFSRQRQLLELLHAFGGTVGRLDFQKLLFLYCQELPTDAPYEFVPYKFGAFSFTSYADRHKLIERGLLAADDHQWMLTKAGLTAINRTCNMHLADFAKRYETIRGDDLVAHTYREFPYFASRSEIAERVLKRDRVALARINQARSLTTSAQLATIGYEGHSLESFLNILLRNGITVLCDVRRNPISRKYGFSKSSLGRGCQSVGIRYEHMAELGIASDRRQNLDTQADYDALFADYEKKWLPKQSAPLDTVGGWMARGESVALTCFEHSPAQCHRRCVSNALESRNRRDVHAVHL